MCQVSSIDGYIMYTDIDFEYHSNLSTTSAKPYFNQVSLHMPGEEISSKGAIFI